SRAYRAAPLRALLRRRSVLAAELRRRPFQPFRLPIEPGLPGPGALEVVPDGEAQPAQALGLHLDRIAVLVRAETTVVGAGGENVTGLERVDRGDPLDASRDLVGHVAGAEALLQGAVDPQPDLQRVRVADLVGRHDVRSDGREGVARLRLVER